nr:MAG TPA: MucB/RseB C-terminal domain [Caudoviricetes sp.]
MTSPSRGCIKKGRGGWKFCWLPAGYFACYYWRGAFC